MKVRIGLKNLLSGTLEGGQFFTAHPLVLEAREMLVAAGEWNHVAVDAFYQELPYYFSDVPMYRVRHIKGGGQAGEWSDSPAKAVRSFFDIRDRVLGDTGEKIPLTGARGAMLFCVINHLGSPHEEDRNRCWKAPEAAGMFALNRSWGGDNYLYVNSRGESWFKSLRALFCFCSGRKFPRYGVTVLESIGNGTWETRPEIDPFM